MSALVDPFGRTISYLRLSVTDRCDFRCLYCMAEEMTFLPRKEILTFEELLQISTTFTQLGVNKIRITGGEPLIRKDILQLFHGLGKLPLKEIALTTNGSHLGEMATELKSAGLSSINISIDSLKAERFKRMSRTGDLNQVLQGIQSAVSTGFKRIRLNSVILKDMNDDEILPLIEFAIEHQVDIAFIEEMPLGSIDSHNRDNSLISSPDILQAAESRYQLSPINDNTGGPARYYQIRNTKTRLGLISPHSQNFCSSCNRVRLTAHGKLLLCLGNEDAFDLKNILRNPEADEAALKESIIQAMKLKPEKHHFKSEDAVEIVRFMNHTGG